MELLKYQIGAIEDWKARQISAERLFEIFRINPNQAYDNLSAALDQADKTTWFDLPTEHIAQILLSGGIYPTGE